MVPVPRELRRQWRAWLALPLLIGGLGGAVLTAAAGARRTDTAYSRLECSEKAADVLMSRNGTGLTGYSDALRSQPGVAAVAKVVLFEFAFAPSSASTTGPGGAPDQNISFVAGVDDTEVLSVSRPKILQGRLFDPNRSDEALVDPDIARRYHLRPRSTFTLLARPRIAQVQCRVEVQGEMRAKAQGEASRVAGLGRADRRALAFNALQCVWQGSPCPTTKSSPLRRRTTSLRSLSHRRSYGASAYPSSALTG